MKRSEQRTVRRAATAQAQAGALVRAALLLLVLNAGGWGGAERLFGRRREAALTAVRASHDSLADAFLEMDTTQRTMMMRAEFGALDGSRAGAQILATARELSAAADVAAQSYLDALDQHRLDEAPGSAPLTAAALSAATAAYDASRAQLAAASAAMRAHTDATAAQFTAVENAMARMRASAAPAQERLIAARRAIARATGDGFHPARAVAALREAERLLRDADPDNRQRGDLQARTEAAAQAAERAGEALALALALPELRAHVQTRLVSIRTRIDVVERKVTALPQTLSELRRDFVFAASADLAAPAASVPAHLDAMRVHLAEAERLAGPLEHQWEEAADALSAARDELDAAEKAVDLILARAATLAQTAADPGAALHEVRFAVREAQRLLLSAHLPTEASFARELDSLAARLDDAQAHLSGPRPDVWGYLCVLDEVTTATASAVARIRATIASAHRR